MHWTGKTLAWLIVLGLAGATVLTAKTLQVRNGWAVKAQQAGERWDQLKPQLEAKKDEFSKAKMELARVLLQWERSWENVPTNIGANGILSIDLGSNQGLKDQQIIFGFIPSPDGRQSQYAGSFQVTTLRENQAALAPAFRVRPEDAQRVQSGNWRFWSLVPTSYRTIDSALESDMVVAEERLRESTNDVQRETSELQSAQAQKQVREDELVGGESLPADNNALPIEEREGLIAAIATEEAARDVELLEVDRLRRELRRLYADLRKTQQENLAGVKKLPQPPEQTAIGASLDRPR